MADEKPLKHKPNKKHTLDEVLKSLQDLIRNDLVSARQVSLDSLPRNESALAQEPDALNATLNRLDELITREIIQPTERARNAPALTPEEEAELDATAELDDEPEPPPEPEVPPVDEHTVARAVRLKKSGFQERRKHPPIEEPPEKPGVPPLFGMQESFGFNKPPAIEAAEALNIDESFENYDAGEAAPAPDEPARGSHADEAAPTEPEIGDWATQASAEHIEPETNPGASGDPAAEAALHYDEGSITEEPNARPRHHDHPPATTQPAEDDIPVLNEVADIEAALPPAPPLPDAAQAREIAIRVIARLNIERRKTGQPALDIRTIERMQQLLSDALTKRAMHKAKDPDSSH